MPQPVPKWLLEELFLSSGSFTDDTETSVVGRPNPHLSAVLNTGRGSPTSTKSISLTEAQLQRLHDQKCVVKEQPDGSKYCTTHGYQLEEMSVSELAPTDNPNPVINRAWRCPKGGTVMLPQFK
jgi:hypothetical protein